MTQWKVLPAKNGNVTTDKKEKKVISQTTVLSHIQKKFGDDNDDENYCKVQDHCYYTSKYRGAAHNITHLRYKIPKENHVVLHNYDYFFIIRELMEESEGQFEC